MLASQSQQHFRLVEGNAATIGMKLNEEKTRMLCILSARSYRPKPFLITSNGNEILPVDTMKILGFHFNNEPSVNYNMQIVQRKFKCRIWSLRHLKRNGFSKSELVRVYTSMIRPVAEYCSSVFHSMITSADSLELERIQMQALKGIFCWRISYSKLLEMSGLERLDTRREEAFVKLANKMVDSTRFTSWFPRYQKSRHDLRKVPTFRTFRASTVRYSKSPLNVMRKRMNDMLSS